MKKQIITGLRFLTLMTILTGIVYPAIVTVITSLFFNREVHGSLVERNGVILGSELIGQNFSSPEYFWSRPSFNNYNPLPSGASNLGLLNPLLINKIIQREKEFLQGNKIKGNLNIPPEMVTASASGLDPHISPTAALLQVNRVAKARGMNQERHDQLVSLINELTEKRQFSLLGEPRINVFLLNLKVDNLK
ncbi:MAG: potassium-transporting ATPase subunit KdpC [Bacteroidia bacterium]|nr:potassium-transporting ATPase subunit KdpC [Bacteroidia bacterium]